MFPIVFSNTYEYPLSGNVMQSISPMLNFEIAGIPEVEHEVVTTVASYGKQLGKLTEAVLLLAEKAGVSGAEIDAVQELRDGVEAAKGRAAEAVRARAEAVRVRAEKLEELGK
ncbi:MAG: hypothetical protein AAFX07_04590 [Pseudomonadota bacterium]